MASSSIIQLAYHVVDELGVSPTGRTVAQLAQQLRADYRSIAGALAWLRQQRAPISVRKRGRQRLRVLNEPEWRIPFGSLDSQSQIWELERAIAPGAEASLLDCVLRLRRENRALRERLIKQTAHA